MVKPITDEDMTRYMGLNYVELAYLVRHRLSLYGGDFIDATHLSMLRIREHVIRAALATLVNDTTLTENVYGALLVPSLHVKKPMMLVPYSYVGDIYREAGMNMNRKSIKPDYHEYVEGTE